MYLSFKGKIMFKTKIRCIFSLLQNCAEHLTMLMEILNRKTMEKSGLIMTFADIRKCFDRVHMADAHFFLIQNEADMKAVKMLSILLDKNILSLSESKKSFEIRVGQDC